MPRIKITLDFRHDGTFWKRQKKRRAVEQKCEPKKVMLVGEDAVDSPTIWDSKQGTVPLSVGVSAT